MFYKFDGFFNRLAPTSPRIATNPSGFHLPVNDREAEFIFESKKVQPVKVEQEVRTVHAQSAVAAAGSKSGGVIPASAGYANIVNLQNKWIKNDGLLVWQKRGMRDMAGYYATLAACGASTVYVFYLIYKMSFPRPPQE